MATGEVRGAFSTSEPGCGSDVSAIRTKAVRTAFELGIDYAQQRETFGQKIAEHQAILFRLAEMATKVEAAHQKMVKAARVKDAGGRRCP